MAHRPVEMFLSSVMTVEPLETFAGSWIRDMLADYTNIWHVSINEWTVTHTATMRTFCVVLVSVKYGIVRELVLIGVRY
jgi:hypothetical protein